MNTIKLTPKGWPYPATWEVVLEKYGDTNEVDIVVQNKDERWHLARVSGDGTLQLHGWCPSESGFKVDEAGYIKTVKIVEE